MKELVEKKNDLITRAESVLNTAKAEKRELTEAEAQELAEIRDDIRRIKETLKLDDDFREIAQEDVPVEENKEVVEMTEERALTNERLEEMAFENYLRGFEVHERANSENLSTASGVGGKLIPTSVAKRIIAKVYDICPILERSQKYNVKGNLEIPFYPADEDEITVAYATEFSDLTSTTGDYNTISLTGFLAGALTKVSRSLINNTEFDIVGFVVEQMAYAIKRFIEHEMLVGTPASGADPAKVLGLSTLTNAVTADATTAVTADELIELHDSIKDEYQQNAIWIMSPATRTAIRQLKDEVGRYLLQDDISLPFGVSLLGKPVYVSDNMPDMSASAKAIYYGDLTGLATKFSEEMNIDVLRERYAPQHAIGVIGWVEFDAKVQNEQKLAVLTMHSA